MYHHKATIFFFFIFICNINFWCTKIKSINIKQQNNFFYLTIFENFIKIDGMYVMLIFVVNNWLKSVVFYDSPGYVAPHVAYYTGLKSCGTLNPHFVVTGFLCIVCIGVTIGSYGYGNQYLQKHHTLRFKFEYQSLTDFYRHFPSFTDNSVV